MKAWWLAVVLLASACALRRHPPPAPPRHTQLDLKVSTLELSNGLRVVLVRDPRAAEIQVTMRYRVGAVDDPPAQPGMAHLVEHLMFQQVLGAQSLFAHLQDTTTYFNATTSLDATTYVARARADQLEQLLSIEGVRLGFRCAGIADSTFTREREVVVNEVRQRDDATRMRAAIHDALYPKGHPYRASIGGTVESVGEITREQACGFADTHYTPSNAVLVVSGNVTQDRVAAALGKLIGRIAKRPAPAAVPVREVVMAAQNLQAPAPIDDEAVLVAWPVPREPATRARFHAIALVGSGLIDAEIRGAVSTFELGDQRAPMLAILLVPGRGESIGDVLAGAQRGLDKLPGAFGLTPIAELGELAFDNLQQSAIHRLFASLEEDERDTRLASHVLADRDPNVALAAEFQGVRELSRENAASFARAYISFDRAKVIRLKPSVNDKPGREVQPIAPINDRGLHRDPPDPAEAYRPISGAPGPLANMTTRELPNGLKVVLLPLTSVPIIEVRLVFGSGTGAEPPNARGAASVAARALTWNPRYLNDLLLFAAAGGKSLVDVGTDHTTFTARGVSMHLDLLLAGLRRWTRDGIYDDTAGRIVGVMRDETRKRDDEGATTDAWRSALFGDDHPYAKAGLARHSSTTLAAGDADRFREAHYTPDNATLVIAGRFDAALAARWIDYLFGDWTGRAAPRAPTPRATTRPASIATIDDVTQVHLDVAFPALAGTRAHQLVVAEMLSEVAGRVRHQLAASYGVDGHLTESRFATLYRLAGSIDAQRADDAVRLLREQVELLRTDKDAGARAFVTARRRVLAKLGSLGSANVLATRVEHDVGLRRAPMSDVASANEVRSLTLPSVMPSLADLDFARAAIRARGPGNELEATFAALGRQPTYVRAAPTTNQAAAPTPPTAPPSRPTISRNDLEDPLTLQGPKKLFTLMLGASVTAGRAFGIETRGTTVTGDVGLRISESYAFGLHLSIGSVSGSEVPFIGSTEVDTVDIVPIEILAFVQAVAFDRLWFAPVAGLYLGHTSRDEGPKTWDPGIGFGIKVGIDLVSFRHRLGLYLTANGAFVSEAGYGNAGVGLTYRQ